MAGRRVGDFTLHGVLGRGAFGVVYKAENNKGEVFALKRLTETFETEKNVEGELKIVGEKLLHENIVYLHDTYIHVGEEMYSTYIIMEFCEGGDLGDYMIKHKPDLSRRFSFMVDVARGVSFLHLKGIIHRDIKPENILLKHKGDKEVCKITDFGLSRIKERRSHVFASQVGSLAYIAPEVLDGLPYNTSVDVFALGLLFFALRNEVIVQNPDGVKWFTPAKIHSETRYEFLNAVIRKENPALEDFIQSFFPDTNDVGNLVYAMIQSNPGTRPMMDVVLSEIVKAQTLHDAQSSMRKLQVRDAELQSEKAKIQSEKSKIQSEKSNLQSENARLLSEKDELQSEIERLRGLHTGRKLEAHQQPDRFKRAPRGQHVQQGRGGVDQPQAPAATVAAQEATATEDLRADW